MEIALDLPLPTSTNVIWRKGRGRTYLNPTYVKWKQTADAHLLRQKVNQRWHTIGGWFTLELIVSDKKKGKLDLDNRVKGVLDWAQQAGVVENDKYLDRLVCTWGDAPLGIRAIFRSNADPAG